MRIALALITLLACTLARADGAVQPANDVAIGTVQGSSDTSPHVGETVALRGVVSADFQGSEQLGGFFLQDPSGDGDPETSDGIFVTAAPGLLDVAVGDALRVIGTVAEVAGTTTLIASAITPLPGGQALSPTPVSLPQPHDDDLERYEGMLIALSELTVVQTQNYERLGQLVLAGPNARAEPDRLWQPTQLWLPGSNEARALEDENRRRVIVLDDAHNGRPDLAAGGGLPHIGSEPVRGGDRIAKLVGVLDQGPSELGASYRLQPTAAVEYRADNARPRAPKLQGLAIASVNLLNYFTSLGRRGAGSNESLARQRAKLVRSLIELDASIYGLTELENNTGPRAALTDLVSALNQASPHTAFAAVDTGRLGTDDIKVALVYRADRVALVGHWAVLDDRVDPRAISTRNRPVLAQTFRDLASSEELTVVVDHWKAKGAGCQTARPGTHEIIDVDTGDGQGHCNHTRVSMASALAAWLAKHPTGSLDPDVLIVGDLNAYAREEPVRTLEAQGFVNLIERQLGGSAYTFVFDARAGYLDHVLASPSLAAKLNRVAIWHSNADEPSADLASDSAPTSAYRASDHDPVVVAFTLQESPPTPIVPALDDYGGWIMLFGSTLLVLWASGAAARRRRQRQILAQTRAPVAR